MAMYTHNNEDDIPYFEHIKMFQELEENDTVYVVDLTSLNITEEKVTDVDKKNNTEIVYGKLLFGPKIISRDREFEYTSVFFRISDENGSHHIGIHFGTETHYLDKCDKLLICTTEREAKSIVTIIEAKCNIQIAQFKSIFNGAGFNYEPKHYNIE